MGKKTLFVLLVMAVFACSAVAADIGFKGANLRLGYVMPEDPVESTIGFGGGIDLGTITENVGLDVIVLYWSKSYDVNAANWTYSDLAIKVHGKYYIPMENLKPYVGAGVGLHMYSFEWEQPAIGWLEAGTYDDSDTKFGIHFFGGMEFPLSDKMGAFVEAEYDLADLDQFIIGGGVSMKFGQ
jgi:opacity protein-like surface antigen